MTLLTRNGSKELSESAALVAESGETQPTRLICLGRSKPFKSMAVQIFLGSSQLRVLSLGRDVDWNVRIGVFPEREEIVIGRLGLGSVAVQSVGAG